MQGEKEDELLVFQTRNPPPFNATRTHQFPIHIYILKVLHLHTVLRTYLLTDTVNGLGKGGI